jgi:L-amino acid N-acyltransferase YncA
MDAALSFARATPVDWPSLWPIFQAVVSAGDTYMYAPAITQEEARELWMPSGADAAARIVYIARMGDQIVGTAYVRPNAPVGGPGDHVCNAGWMVAPTCRGAGVGRRFAEHVIADARARGYRAMQFNAVVSSNQHAVALWLSLGFRILGTAPGAFRHPTLGPVGVHVMWREL